MRQTFLVVLALVVVLGTSGRGVAEDGELNRATLKGLQGVEIVVESFGEGDKRAGFNQQVFKTDAELKLRLAGIRVLTQAESLATQGKPALYINVNTLADEPGEVDAFAITVELSQVVLLNRDPSVLIPAVTWGVGSLGRGRVSHARNAVKDQLDQFLVAWLSVNPKK